MLTAIIFSKFAGPIIRHGATSLGAVLIAKGWADAATAEAIVGGLTAAGGLVLSFAEKAVRA